MKNKKILIGGAAAIVAAFCAVGLYMVKKPSQDTLLDSSANQGQIPTYTPPKEENQNPAQPSQPSKPQGNPPVETEQLPSDNTPADTPDTSDNTPPAADTPVVYVPDEQEEILSPVATETEDDSDQGLVNALISSGTLPEGVEVLSASVKDGVLQLDMNDIYGAAVQSSGTTGENTLVYGLVNTFAHAKDVKQVLITVDGEALESGHEIYDYALEPTDE